MSAQLLDIVEQVPDPTVDHQDQKTVFVSEPTPRLKQIAYFCGLWAIKVLAFSVFTIGTIYRRAPASEKPSAVKAYPVRPRLKNSIFLPDRHDSGDKFPLYIDVHGGGFANGTPQMDDKFCASLAAEFGMVVVSLSYSKSPTHPFPGAVNDLIALTKAVIADGSLPVDRKRIVLGGFSAGSNLCFAVAQDPDISAALCAIVGYYPVLDFSETIEDKLARKSTSAKGLDALIYSAQFSDFGYVPQGQNRRDPSLSPLWADMNTFPGHVYLIGAEHDVLCSEALMMAEKLATHHNKELEAPREAIPGLDIDQGWRQGPICWELAKGKPHGFADSVFWFDEEREAERAEYCRLMFGRISNWLETDVWAK